MEAIERLLKKVERASDELIDLKRDNRRLASELEALRHQLRDHQLVLKENERHRRDADKLRGRLTRLHKKVEKALMVAPSALAGAEGGSSEEHPQ
jgi:hypothetical protein